MSLNAYLSFDGNCLEAFELYRSGFGGEYQELQTFGDGPPDRNVPEWQKDRIMRTSLAVGSSVLTGGDTATGHGQRRVRDTHLAISIVGEGRNIVTVNI